MNIVSAHDPLMHMNTKEHLPCFVVGSLVVLVVVGDSTQTASHRHQQELPNKIFLLIATTTTIMISVCVCQPQEHSS